MTEIAAPIEDVTVYSDRALITRRGSIELTAGEHELRINNLPQFLHESLRTAGQGPQGTRILNVDITTAFYSLPPETELLTLQVELDHLRQRHELLKARRDALNDRRQWLRALGEQSHDFARGLARGQMKPQDCADFLKFMAEQAQQDAEAAQDLELHLKQAGLEVAAKERELKQKRRPNDRPDRLAALITVELATAGTLHLELSYLVMNASWHPHYDVRVQVHDDQSSGTVEVTYLGEVQQATGEAWEHVALSLSTARPALAAVLPELKPWYLNAYVPPEPRPLAKPMRYRAAGAATSASRGPEDDELMLDSYGAAAVAAPLPPPAAPVPVEVAVTSVERTGTALVFRAGRSVDIPSDNSPHKTTIARDSLPCEFDYVCAPGIEEQIHLRATITNTTERVLLEGQTSIFLSGEYVGTTQVKMTAPSEEFKIFLGLDDAIKVKRKVIERTVEKGNILQNDIRRSIYAYRITVHNYATVSRKIVVFDHLPVPQHERIKVRVQNIQPQPTEHTKLEVLTWKFTLPPDGEQKIEYRFMVEHPQDLVVIGLPAQNDL